MLLAFLGKRDVHQLIFGSNGLSRQIDRQKAINVIISIKKMDGLATITAQNHGASMETSIFSLRGRQESFSSG